jgi:AcrR family transcriptional regulator
MGDKNMDLFIRPQKKVQENPLRELPKLFDAALNEFSQKSFDSASLNDIIKASGISKGSFYHKFTDKKDLYLCMFDRVSQEKVKFFAERYTAEDFPKDFFEQIRIIVKLGIDYALHEPRYYALWRIFLAENIEVKGMVKEAFPFRGRDEFEQLISIAYENEQFNSKYNSKFITGIIQLLIYNVDSLIDKEMGENDILQLINNLIEMLKNGLQKK